MRSEFLLCLLASVTLVACDPHSMGGPEMAEEDPAVYHGMIQLGEKLNDPYTVENMQAAVDATYGTRAARVKVEASHRYVRFLPADEDQYNFLVKSGIEMLDHPLDYRILREGDFYHDPEIPDDDITWLYAVLPVDQPVPDGIRYEILDECFIPSEETTRAAESWIDWDEIERKSYELTGNAEDLRPGTRSEYFCPSGRITIVDDKYNGGEPVGVSGVEVSVNAFVKFCKTHTDKDGYYTINRAFNTDLRYRLVFSNTLGFGIGMNLILVPASTSALGKGTPEGMDVEITSASERKMFCRAAVNNAAYDYFTRCSSEETNLKAPPTNLRIWLFQSLSVSSTPMLHQGTVLDQSLFSKYLGVYSSLIKTFLPDITLGLEDAEDYASIYSRAVHELAHASHFMSVGIPYWDRFIDFIIKSFVTSGWVVYGVGTEENAGYCEVGEMWGYYMENKLYRERYGDYSGGAGTSYWFHPQIFLYLDERGLADRKIFRALDSEVTSREELRDRLLLLYPEFRSIIEQAFERYE